VNSAAGRLAQQREAQHHHSNGEPADPVIRLESIRIFKADGPGHFTEPGEQEIDPRHAIRSWSKARKHAKAGDNLVPPFILLLLLLILIGLLLLLSILILLICFQQKQ
jgi:hypothetical protein